MCGYTSLEFKDVEKPELTDKSYGEAVDNDIKLSCPESGYISEMEIFGFLYMLDYEAGSISHPNSECKKVDHVGYKDVSTPSFLSSQKSKSKFDELTLLKAQPGNTDLNIDAECNLETIFDNSETNEKSFFEYFEANCVGKNECTLEKSEILPLLSTKCISRIFSEQITSKYLLTTATCKDDRLHSPFGIEKKGAGTLIVFFDIVSLMITFYVFSRLILINEEYISTMDNNIVKISSFTIQIDDFKVPKNTKSLRELRFKILEFFKDKLDKEIREDK